MKAYEKGKAEMAACAAGTGCDKSHAQDATDGLEVLGRAEADHSVLIYLQLGDAKGKNVATTDLQSTPGTVITIDPTHPDFVGATALYGVDGTAVHEVNEQYSKNVLFGLSRPNSLAHDHVHYNAIKYGEDPVYLGSHRPSRTSRTPGCDVNHNNPNPISAPGAQVCF